MSNTITAYFKGRIGVAESVYQNDYGIVMAFDSIDLPAHFDCYFTVTGSNTAIPGVGADNRVAIPNTVLANSGKVEIHIPLHTGENDSEVEYVVYFKVIGRARPEDDGTPTQMTAIEQALALLQNPITNIEQIVNEALAFTGETFEEMQEDLDEWKTDTEEGLETWKGGVESDFDNLDAQFQTAVAAVTTDTEVTNIRVGDDNVIYTTAGEAVRKQFASVKSDINPLLMDSLVEVLTEYESVSGYYDDQGTVTTYGNVLIATIAVNGGEHYWLSSRDYFAAVRALFLDSSDNFISAIKTGTGTDYHEKTSIVVPTSARKMLIQKIGTTSPTILYEADIDGMIADLQTAVDLTTEPKTESESLTFQSTTGYYTANGSFEPMSQTTQATIAVTAGERYLINTRNFYTAAIVVFFNNSDVFVSSVWLANNADDVRDYEVSVPAGATKMMLQRFVDYEPTTARKIVGMQAVKSSSLLKEKKVTLIGDSITEKNYRAKTNWAMYLSDWCGAIVQNLGIGGTGFRAGVASNINYYSRLSSIQSSPDIIGIALSFNDIADESVNLGTVNDTSSDNTVAGYANDFFDALITAYPTTPIICYCQSPWSVFHSGKARSDSWIAILTEICNIRGIPFYKDQYYGSTLKPWLSASRSEFFTSDDTDGGSIGDVDGIHPNSNGHKVIARYLYPKFVENLVADGINYN